MKKRTMFRTIAAGLVTAAALALASCGGNSAAAGKCPKIGVLPDASDLPVTNAAGEIVALARLSVANGACIYDKTQVTRTGYSKVQFPLTVRVSVARTQGSGVGDIDVKYIVATVSEDGVVTGKQVYDMSVSFDGRTGFEDETLLITMPYEGNGSASQHRIVAAFQLDRETVRINRQRLGR